MGKEFGSQIFRDQIESLFFTLLKRQRERKGVRERKTERNETGEGENERRQ